MKVWIVEVEHFAVPGRPIKAFLTQGAAVDEAVSLVNIMIKDNNDTGPRGIPCNASNWQAAVEELQDQHGAQFCYVEIQELEATS